MVMSATYPITFLAQHQFWSISLYILLGTAIGFSVAALRYRPECSRWVLITGVITAFVDILSGVIHEVYLLEWFTVVLFLVFLFILSMETRAAKNAGPSRSGVLPSNKPANKNGDALPTSATRKATNCRSTSPGRAIRSFRIRVKL